MSDKGKVIVVQYGARRMYAVPSALAQSDKLERFYTDFSLNAKMAWLKRIIERLFPSIKSALGRRTLPNNICTRTTSFPRWTFDLTRSTRILDASLRIKAMNKAHIRAGQAMLGYGFGDATHVLSIFGEGRNFLTAAKQNGLTICIDVNIAFSTESILSQAAKKYPNWGKHTFFEGDSSSSGVSIRKFILDVADKLFCPSEFVARDLIENHHANPDKVYIVPYAVSDFWFELENSPKPGRILFAGSPDLRKGLPVLAEVAKILNSKNSICEVVVVGRVASEIAEKLECKHLKFLGPMTAIQLREEMSKADVFCFPSYAEGSAAVTYEALAAALPLVTTEAAGSVVVHGESGFIVPTDDAKKTADALLAIVDDRSLRQKLSQGARLRASEFIWPRYADRLTEAIFR